MDLNQNHMLLILKVKAFVSGAWGTLKMKTPGLICL